MLCRSKAGEPRHPERRPSFDASIGLRAGTVLPVARYRFRFRMKENLVLPEFAGSLLRGQFGAALRNAACVTGAETCSGCTLSNTCPYSVIFDTPAPAAQVAKKYSQVPNPYVIEPPSFGTRSIPAGGLLEFGLVLVGRAQSRLPLISLAIQRAFGRGIGGNRVQGCLEDVLLQRAQGEASVWNPDRRQLLPHDSHITVPAFDGCRTVRLAIETPLRLQSNGRPLGPAELSPRRLIAAIMRRSGLLFEIHAGLPGLSSEASLATREAESLSDSRLLLWRDWRRYSSRQQAEMTLGGVVGTWEVRGDLSRLSAWFWLGQWLHIGKNVTMGLGRYSATFS